VLFTVKERIHARRLSFPAAFVLWFSSSPCAVMPSLGSSSALNSLEVKDFERKPPILDASPSAVAAALSSLSVSSFRSFLCFSDYPWLALHVLMCEFSQSAITPPFCPDPFDLGQA